MAAGWQPDPTQRFALRYFDGINWTDNVSDGNGNQSKDAVPVVAAPVAPPAAAGAYPPPPPGYAYPPPGYGYAPSRPWNGLAIAGFVLSLVWMYGVGSILAIIFGHISRKQIREQHQQGGGLALAGLIIGYIGLAIGVLVIIFIVAAVNDPSFNTDF